MWAAEDHQPIESLPILRNHPQSAREPFSGFDQELHRQGARSGRALPVPVPPRYDHERMTLPPRSKATSGQPYVDVMARLDIPSTRNVDLDPESAAGGSSPRFAGDDLTLPHGWSSGCGFIVGVRFVL